MSEGSSQGSASQHQEAVLLRIVWSKLFGERPHSRLFSPGPWGEWARGSASSPHGGEGLEAARLMEGPLTLALSFPDPIVLRLLVVITSPPFCVLVVASGCYESLGSLAKFLWFPSSSGRRSIPSIEHPLVEAHRVVSLFQTEPLSPSLPLNLPPFLFII